jgi:hypothetical protein
MSGEISSFPLQLIQAIWSLATAGALYFLWKQSRDTQKQTSLTQKQTSLTQKQTSLTQEQVRLAREEMESTLRPWIAIGDLSKDVNNKLNINLKNYGNIPARVVNKLELIDTKPLSEKELCSTGEKSGYDFMIYPDAVEKIKISRPLEVSEKWVGVFFEYEYGNKKQGHSGVIAEYDDVKKSFKMKRQWAN